MKCLGFRVCGVGCKAKGLGFGVEGLSARITLGGFWRWGQGLGFRGKRQLGEEFGGQR